MPVRACGYYSPTASPHELGMTKGVLLVLPYQCFPSAEQHAVMLSRNCLLDLTCVLLRLHLPPFCHADAPRQGCHHLHP